MNPEAAMLRGELEGWHEALEEGEFDAVLSDIKSWVNARIAKVNQDKLANLAIGDRVKFGSHVVPKYLQRYQGTVEFILDDGKVQVDIGYTGRRFSGVVTTPRSLLVKL